MQTRKHKSRFRFPKSRPHQRRRGEGFARRGGASESRRWPARRRSRPVATQCGRVETFVFGQAAARLVAAALLVARARVALTPQAVMTNTRLPDLDEEKFIQVYVWLTDCAPATARSVYIHLGLLAGAWSGLGPDPSEANGSQTARFQERSPGDPPARLVQVEADRRPAVGSRPASHHSAGVGAG